MALKPALVCTALLAAAVAMPALLSGSRADEQKTGRMPGGEATAARAETGQDAFSQPVGNLRGEAKAAFVNGNRLFRQVWTAGSETGKGGLGPLFNARSCSECHVRDGRGQPVAADGFAHVSMPFRSGVLSIESEDIEKLKNNLVSVFPDPAYGHQLQTGAVPGHRPEARIEITYSEVPVELNGGEIVNLRRPEYKITDLAYGRMIPGRMISPRIAPPMVGLGLLEAVSEEDILKHVDPDDADGDGVSGKPNRIWSRENKAVVLGRFGWKAGQPTLRQQVASAFAMDMGLSTPLFMPAHGDCSEKQHACRAAAQGSRNNMPEVPEKALDDVVLYIARLAVPQRRNADRPDIQAGEKLFHAAGCAKCHVPSFTTATEPHVAPELRGQRIWPYTDMLLHDLGTGLADTFAEGAADFWEWRTPPLWGIGLTRAVNGHTYFLHDGRARNLLEAILWHGGEAESARKRVIEMTRQERGQLIAFIESL